MKIKQLVIFSIVNYIFENIYTILKTELYDHDKKGILRYVNNNNNNNNKYLCRIAFQY